MIRQCLMLAIALLALVVTAPTSAKEATDVDRFKLWYACYGLNLVVEDLPWNATGLTKGHIETAVRKRLSAARLLDTKDWRPFLHVQVKVVQTQFEVVVRLYKHLFDRRASKLENFAMTWERRVVGRHAGDGNHVLSQVLRFTDTFIDEYLRVNAEACQ